MPRVLKKPTVISWTMWSSALTALCLAFPALALISEPNNTFALSGDYASSGGEATYRLPIIVAPGRAEHQPELSLDYKSDTPNGLMGMGWSLSGTSSVYRCGKNLHTDGLWGGVNFDDNDRYCLDGQRLIAVKGKDGGDLTEYRAEKNGYDKIVSFGHSGDSGPAYFKVWRTDGTVHEYGVTADARVELPGQSNVYQWARNRVTDISKHNDITYHYQEDNAAGTHQLSRIRYVGGSVAFGYEDRADKAYQYLYGSRLQRAQRLATITIQDANQVEVGTYHLNYQTSPVTSRSLVKDIQYCSEDGLCSTRVAFEWNDYSHFSGELCDGDCATGNGENLVYQREKAEIDFEHVRFFDEDRDGHKTPYGVVADHESLGWCTYSGATNGFTGTMRDLAGAETEPGMEGFTLAGSLNAPELLPRPYEIGYNGACGPNGTYNKYKYEYNDDIPSARSYMPERDGVLVDYSEQSVHYFAGDFNGDGKQELRIKPSNREPITPIVADFDNDNIDDFAYFNVDHNYYSKFYFSLSGHQHQMFSIDATSYYKDYRSVDINNDGYLDWLVIRRTSGSSIDSVIDFYLYNGKTFVKTSTSITFPYEQVDPYEEKVKLMDYNGDGYPELYINGTFYLNEAGTINYEKIVGESIPNIDYVDDINGDGLVDFVSRQKSNEYNGHDKLFTHLSTPYPVDKINHIEEQAIDYWIGYQSAAEDSVHTQKRYFDYPFMNTTPTRYLVSEVKKQPKGYQPTTLLYHYEGAMAHAAGGGFLGFRTIIETEQADVLTTRVQEYLQLDLPTAGELERESVYRQSADSAPYTYSPLDLLTQTKYTYTTKLAGARYQVYANKKVKHVYDDVIVKQEVTTQTLNEFGSIIQEQVITRAGGSSTDNYTTTVENQYLSNGYTTSSHTINTIIQSDVPELDATFEDYDQGFTAYCAANSNVMYFKPEDEFVLLHGDVATPILVDAHSQYYRYDVTQTDTDDYNGLTYNQGTLTTITQAEFEAQSLTACGHYTYDELTGDALPELSTTTDNVTELITENGNDYWQVSALRHSQKTVSGDLSGLAKETTTDYAYTDTGLLQTMTVGGGAYETGGPSGKTLTQRYRYDSVGNVVSETQSGTELAARTTTYQYDAQQLYVTKTVNAMGHATTKTYNALGQVLVSVSPLKGRTTRYQYDAFHRVTQETLPGTGNITTTQYQLGEACLAAQTTTASCVGTTEGNGTQTLVHYDYAGREVRQMHRAFDGEWVTVDTTWDRNGRKRTMTRPQFLKVTTPAPQVSFDYDDFDREIRKVEPANRGALAIFTTQYEGYTATTTDARGYQRKIIHNVMGHILRKEEPLGAYQTYTYYPDGKLKSTTDSAGNTTTTQYDNLGHRSYLNDPDVGEWTYRYNAAGELTYKQDANGVVTTISYDALGRKTQQKEGNDVSTWRYDENGALGTLSGFAGHGQQTDYYYDANGLLFEQAMTVDGDIFSTQYQYDAYERIAREVRPDGRTLNDALGKPDNNRLAVEYIYNPYGYLAAVRSPRTYADDVFTSAKFRKDIRQMLNDAIAQANEYLIKADRYAKQTTLFEQKAAQYQSQTVDVYNLDETSANLLTHARYKQWCDSEGNCYLRPATWVLLHDDVTIPLDITLDGEMYQLTTTPGYSSDGMNHHDVTVTPVSPNDLSGLDLTQGDDVLLSGDYDGDGAADLMHQSDIYSARVDDETREELLFAADDIAEAADIANRYYKLYTDLAEDLIDMAEKVAKLSGLYCEYANDLAGDHADASLRTQCQSDGGVSQADHLQTILTQSELEEASGNPAYFYYWQRRDTDAYDHTAAETLGNGLANTYEYDASTGRPNAMYTHKASQIGSANNPNNVRYLRYQYDNHNNVTQRYDDQLGITDRWTYDALDRVKTNTIALNDKDQHGLNNPDLTGPKTFEYDTLGNLTYQTDIGAYQYGTQAGPHAVTKANGLTYQYDKVGNLQRAYTDTMTERSMSWSSFNKPTQIVRDGNTVTFAYDAEHNRYKKTSSDGTDTVYFGNFYERVTNTTTGEIQHKHFVYADGKLIALNTQTTDAEHNLKNKQVRYLHYDALNSVDLITDGYGLVVERRSYDTWGKQRHVVWQTGSAEEVIQEAITNRGYTGHEEITEVGLIHMNGRVYDPELARFTSADPMVQDPYQVNSFNRYAYVQNNPLKYTDPTGFTAEENSSTSGDDGASAGGPESGNGGDNGQDDDSDKTNAETDEATENKAVKDKKNNSKINGKYVVALMIAAGHPDEQINKVANSLNVDETNFDDAKKLGTIALSCIAVIGKKNIPSSRLINKLEDTAASVTKRGAFPKTADEMSSLIGSPKKVGTTPDGTVRTTWTPNSSTKIRHESHPHGLKPGDAGYNPRHHGEHFHVETKPHNMSWSQARKQGQVLKSKPEGYTPGSGTGFLSGENFPGY
ncbi:type IV secretion protein Rhs [Vibrio parahaemolyticus]|nr:type IV secretion protein Rhs [Vibrio parahaemolyticus]MQZ03201.1 type IV secretion protein Rhs [Vibrio parahaemolyticus]MQZ13571.1 type IV secretion protein Rhs [Vibrio parahaemolyticus]